jgi:hypothetical protein
VIVITNFLDSNKKRRSPAPKTVAIAFFRFSHKAIAFSSYSAQVKAIATHLSINVSTVRKHLESIYCKFGVHSRTEAIAQALAKLGILNLPPLV